jgi:hypothetical protein
MPTLTYTTTLKTSEGEEETTKHSISFATREEAERTKWSFSEGDFGDLTCGNFELKEA